MFGRVLNHAEKATKEQVDTFFDRLYPMSLSMEKYIVMQRHELHVHVPLQDLSMEGKLGYYLSQGRQGRQIVFGKCQIVPRSQWCPRYTVRACYHQFVYI